MHAVACIRQRNLVITIFFSAITVFGIEISAAAHRIQEMFGMPARPSVVGDSQRNFGAAHTMADRNFAVAFLVSTLRTIHMVFMEIVIIVAVILVVAVLVLRIVVAVVALVLVSAVAGWNGAAGTAGCNKFQAAGGNQLIGAAMAARTAGRVLGVF